jgi:hypothetical protein
MVSFIVRRIGAGAGPGINRGLPDFRSIRVDDEEETTMRYTRPKPTAPVLLTILPLLAIGSPARAGQESREAMVIVAPEQFHGALEPYRAYRSAQRRTELAKLEAILEETDGVDDPERLKRWLYRAWKQRGVRFALLVGDADALPVRYMVLDRVTPAAFDYAFYPSDLYYADVARRDGGFDDWNARRDDFHAGYFGEVRGEKNKADPINFDAIDYRPELAVGRWPVDSVAAVRTLAAKTMAYERGVLTDRVPGLRRAVFVAVPGWVDTRGPMERWAARLPAGWTATKLSGSPGAEAPPDERQVVALLNEGASLVVHAGHGHDDGWHGSLGTGALPQLHNADRLPVVLSAGCSTARFATLPPYEPYEDVQGARHAGTNAGEVFDAPPPPPAPYARGQDNRTGLGERLLRDGPGGAVAYIGCNTGSQPCALTLLDGFVRSVAERPEPTLGDCWNDAVVHYYEVEHLATIAPTADWYPASIFFQGMKFMVFGDPVLRLPGPSR